MEIKAPQLTVKVERFLYSLGFEPDTVRINAWLDIDYQHYFRSTDAVWINDDDELAHDDFEFYRRFVLMPDFIKLALYAENDASGGLYVSAGIKRRYDRGDFLDSNFMEFHSDRIVRIENYNFRRAYFYHYFSNLEVVLDRNSVHVGDPDFSIFQPTYRLPYLDALTLRYRLGPVYMTSIIPTLENRKAKGELDPDSDPDDASEWPEDWPWLVKDDVNLGFGRTTVLYSLHRFDYIWARLRLGIAPSILPPGKTTPFSWRIFSPFSPGTTRMWGHTI